MYLHRARARRQTCCPSARGRCVGTCLRKEDVRLPKRRPPHTILTSRPPHTEQPCASKPCNLNPTPYTPLPQPETLHSEHHQEGGCKATWKRELELPWREAGPDHLIIAIIEWIRTSRLSINKSLSWHLPTPVVRSMPLDGQKPGRPRFDCTPTAPRSSPAAS